MAKGIKGDESGAYWEERAGLPTSHWDTTIPAHGCKSINMMEESGEETIRQMRKIPCKVRHCQTLYKTQDCRCDLQTIRSVLPSLNHIFGSRQGGEAVVSCGTDLQLSNRKAIPAAHVCSAPCRKHSAALWAGSGGPEGRYSLPTKVGEHSVLMVCKKMGRYKRTGGKKPNCNHGKKGRTKKPDLHKTLFSWLEPPELQGTCWRVSLRWLCAPRVLPALESHPGSA